jgi:hypothetical protein
MTVQLAVDPARFHFFDAATGANAAAADTAKEPAVA